MTEEIRPDEQISEEQLDKIAGGVYIGSFSDENSLGEGYVAPTTSTTTTSTTTSPTTSTTTTSTTSTSTSSPRLAAQLATLRNAVTNNTTTSLYR